MRSIKWCRFQWPWTNPNCFQVTPLSDAKYLRYGHSYYRKRIRNHTQAFEWHRLQWPWVTCKPDFKVTILFNVKKNSKMVQDSYIYNGRPIESRNMVYRTAPFSVTLNDP